MVPKLVLTRSFCEYINWIILFYKYLFWDFSLFLFLHVRYLAIEWCVNTLEDFVKGLYRGPELGSLNIISQQIVEGVAYLHGVGFVHGDLKPSNILISGQNGNSRPKTKLTDFGLRHCNNKGLSFEEKSDRFQAARTKGWMPMDHKIDFPFDIFSAGLVIGYTICRGNYCCWTSVTN